MMMVVVVIGGAIIIMQWLTGRHRLLNRGVKEGVVATGGQSRHIREQRRP